MNYWLRYILLHLIVFFFMSTTVTGIMAAGNQNVTEALLEDKKQAWIMLDKADYDAAQPKLRKIIKIARENGDLQIKLKGEAMLGQVLVLAGNPEEGYKELTSALDEATSLDEKQCNPNEIKTLAYNGLGIYFYTVKGDYYLGKEYFLKAVDIAAKAKDERLAKRFETNLVQAAIIERDTTILKSAQELYDWSVKNNDPYTRYISACQLAQLYSFNGEPAEAIRFIKDAETIAKRNTVGNHIPLYLSKADIYECRGDYAETLHSLDTAIQLLGTGKEAQYYRSVIGSRKTGMYLTAKEYASALECGLQALSFSINLNQRTHVGKLLRQISQAYEGLGNETDALKYARMYENYMDSTYSHDRDFMIRSIAAIYNVDKKEREAEYAKTMLSKEQERNMWLVISIILFAATTITAVLAYIHKARLHKNLVRVYQEMATKEKDLLRQIERMKQSESPLPESDASDRKYVLPDSEIVEISEGTEEKATSETLDRIWTDLILLMENTHDWSDEDTSREAIASKLGTNRTYVSKAVKERTGMTFTQFINSHRIRRATEVLSDPHKKGYPLKALSQELGFKSLNSFYSNFKAVTGISPGLFRRNI